MNKKRIQNQEELDQLVERIDWEHSFIRELYALSPSYLEDDGEVAPDALPGLKILITGFDSEMPGIELFFEKVKEISVDFGIDYEPFGIIDKRGIQFFLTQNRNAAIIAESLTVNILDRSCWGWKTTYGKKNFFDESGFKIETDFD
jgi:hypothetical protein